MLDRFFAPALAFMMLFGVTAMMVSGLFPADRPAAPDEASTIAALYAPADPAGVTLDRVEITAPRAETLRQVEEEDRRLKQQQQQRTSAAPQAAEGRGVMLHPDRE